MHSHQRFSKYIKVTILEASDFVGQSWSEDPSRNSLDTKREYTSTPGTQTLWHSDLIPNSSATELQFLFWNIWNHLKLSDAPVESCCLESRMLPLTAPACLGTGDAPAHGVWIKRDQKGSKGIEAKGIEMDNEKIGTRIYKDCIWLHCVINWIGWNWTAAAFFTYPLVQPPSMCSSKEMPAPARAEVLLYVVHLLLTIPLNFMFGENPVVASHYLCKMVLTAFWNL